MLIIILVRIKKTNRNRILFKHKLSEILTIQENSYFKNNCFFEIRMSYSQVKIESNIKGLDSIKYCEFNLVGFYFIFLESRANNASLSFEPSTLTNPVSTRLNSAFIIINLSSLSISVPAYVND